MKNLAFSLSAAVLLLTLLILNASGIPQSMPEPRSGEEEGENEAEKLKKREAWINYIHRAAPGVDWREMEQQQREARHAAEGPLSMRKTTAMDTLAGGLVIGEWRERGSRNQSGRIHTAEWDTLTQQIFAGADGGQVFHGNADGTGWTVMNDRLKFSGVRLLRMVPHGGAHRLIAVTGGNRVYTTEDMGATWVSAAGLTAVQDWGYIDKAVMMNDSVHTLWMLCQEWDYTNWEPAVSLYRSTDDASSFQRMWIIPESAGGGGSRYDLWAARFGGDSGLYLLATDSLFTLNPADGSRIFRSTIPITNGSGTTMLTGSLAGGDTTLYAWVNREVWRSTDAGLSWAYRSNTANGPFFESSSFACAITDADRVWFGDIECNRSTDGGMTWTAVNGWGAYYGNPAARLHADIPAIIPYLDSVGAEHQFICTDGGMYISDDQTATVRNLSLSGLNVSQYYSVYSHRNNPGYIYAGAQDQGFQRCQNDPGGVLDFTQVISGDYGHIVSGNGGQSIWMNYPGFTEYYNYAPNGGGSASWNFNGTNPLWIPPLMEDPDAPTTAYLAGGSATGGSGSYIMSLSYTGSGTLTVANLPYNFSPSSNGNHVSAMAYSPLDHNRWFAATGNGSFYRSADRGQSWTKTSSFDGPDEHYFYGNCIFTSRVNPDWIWIGGSGYSNPGVYRSVNGGQNFSPASLGLPSTLVFDMAGNDEGTLIFAATEAGPYMYVVSLNQWFPMGTAAPDQVYWSVDYIPGIQTVRFGTYGRGIWDFALTQTPVGQAEPMIAGFSVGPVPAQDQIWIRREAPQAMQVPLTLTDVQGRVLYRMDWNLHAGENALEIPVHLLPAGVYWLNAGQGLTKKIVIQ